MCTVLLPPGDNPIAVNKYNISIHAFYSLQALVYVRFRGGLMKNSGFCHGVVEDFALLGCYAVMMVGG